MESPKNNHLGIARASSHLGRKWRVACAIAVAVCVCLLGLLCLQTNKYAFADSASPASASATAADITGSCSIVMTQPNGSVQPIAAKYTDADYNTYDTLEAGTSITITTGDGASIGALYIIFNYTPEPWTLTVGQKQTQCGMYGYIHEYVGAVGGASATLTFPSQTQLCDVYVLSEGTTPDWVQVWTPAEGRADILYCPTHSDDDQLYLGGIIPTALEAGYSVQTVYFAYHWEEPYRPHELLYGLWHNGLTRYPYMGYMKDRLSWTTIANPELLERAGWSHSDIVAHQVELVRKYQPQIVVCHSLEGEYGHPAHMLNASSMQEAVLAASDASQYVQSAEAYGVWDVPKTYIHEYPENTIVLNLDTPLQKYDGKTAFQIMKEGFAMHKSQVKFESLRTWLYDRDTAAAIPASSNSPCLYGLWRTTVGADTLGNTMFENITSYVEQDKAALLAQQEKTRNIVIGVVVIIVIAGGVLFYRARRMKISAEKN